MINFLPRLFLSLVKTLYLINLQSMAAKSSLGVLLSTAILSGTAFSQLPVTDNLPSFATWLLSSGKDSVTVCAGYSVNYTNLVFLKSGDARDTFSAFLTFSADAIDSATGSNYHRSKSKEVGTPTYEGTRSKKSHAEDFVTLRLPRSVFHIAAELRDDTQRLTYLHTDVRRDFSEIDSSGFDSIIFFDSVSNSSYHPVIQPNVAVFPEPIRFGIVCGNTSPEVTRADLLTKEGKLLRGNANLTRLAAKLRPASIGLDLVFLALPDSNTCIEIGEIRADTLPEGFYQLRIHGKTTQRTFPFCYSWITKPRTLRNFTTAFSLLKYVVQDSIYSEMESGNEKEKIEKFNHFWRSLDPTPGTAYNELEAQFYERADYADNAFATIGARAGASTDRGKAYILFGKPDSVKREYKDDGTLEVWSYTKLKKNLIFKEKGFGEFELYRTENL